MSHLINDTTGIETRSLGLTSLSFSPPCRCHTKKKGRCMCIIELNALQVSKSLMDSKQLLAGLANGATTCQVTQYTRNY